MYERGLGGTVPVFAPALYGVGISGGGRAAKLRSRDGGSAGRGLSGCRVSEVAVAGSIHGAESYQKQALRREGRRCRRLSEMLQTGLSKSP